MRDLVDRQITTERACRLQRCDERGIADVKEWLARMASFIVCRDRLAVSMAIDYDREGGDPERPTTPVASLRREAKPYDRAPTGETYAAANHIAALMVDFLARVPAYAAAELIVAMPRRPPPSRTICRRSWRSTSLLAPAARTGPGRSGQW